MGVLINRVGIERVTCWETVLQKMVVSEVTRKTKEIEDFRLKMEVEKDLISCVKLFFVWKQFVHT